MNSFVGKILGLAMGMVVGVPIHRPGMAAQGPVPAQKKPIDMDGLGSESEYYQALRRIEQLDNNGQRASLVSIDFFQSLSWIGRTACVNYVCGILSMEQCRRVLDHALTDDALVVRDHGLRIMLSSSQFSESEKLFVAERVAKDNRNYRKGRPFWIVDRAKGYLEVHKHPLARN